MRKSTLLLATTLSVLAFTAARAAPLNPGSGIDLLGYVQANGAATINMATSLDFVGVDGVASPNSPGTVVSYGTGSGVFAGFSCEGTCGAIKDISSLATGAQSITDFVSLSGGNNVNPIRFSLTGIDAIGRGDQRILTFTATGVIDYDGYDPNIAQFLFTAQGNTLTSFSASTLGVGVPEPASLAVLGASLAALGLMRRKRST